MDEQKRRVRSPIAKNSIEGAEASAEAQWDDGRG